MNTNTKLAQTFEKVSIFVIAAVAFLMPTFFLTFTTEFFEYNKLALLTLVTLILLGLLVAKVVVGKSLHFQKTGLDLALVLFLIVFILATIFSIDKASSIWGAQGRWFPSLFGVVVLFLFYYVAGPNFKTEQDIKMAIYAFVAGSTVSSIVATLSYFSIYLGQATFFKIDEFTLTGSPVTAAILAVLGTALALYFTYKEKFLPTRALLITATIINFFFAAIVGITYVWILLFIGVAMAIYALNTQKVMEDKFTSMLLMTFLVTISMLTLFPSTREILANKNYSYERELPLKTSWVVSTASIQDYPLLATGPSTFNINYARYRPLTTNDTALWNIRFDKPYNEFLNIMATLGIIGLLSFLFVWIKGLKIALQTFRSAEASDTAKAISIGLALILLSYLFTYTTVLTTFVLFFLLTLLGAVKATANNKSTTQLFELNFSSFTAVTTTIGETSAIKQEYANILAVTPFILAALFGTYLFGKTYLGEYYMRQAVTAAANNQALQAYDFQTKAININPQRSAYHSTYAQTNLAIANAMAAGQDLTDQDKQTIQTLVSQSIRSTRIATEVIKSLNVTDWETRALVYRSLINVADNASEWAIAAYSDAIKLDPSNPSLRIDLGGVYYINGDFLSAANMFKQASTLKPDYANAHYNLAQAFVNLKDLDNARRELELTKALVDPSSEDFKVVTQQLASLDAQNAAVAGATTDQTKPSIEDIVGVDTTAPAQQAPLTQPTQQVEAENLDAGVLPNTQTTEPSN